MFLCHERFAAPVLFLISTLSLIGCGDDSVSLAPTASPVTSMITPLNDTGITWGSNYPNGNNTTCIGETISQQDCSHGRDVTHDDSNGRAGFDYTKLNANGTPLSASDTEWSCIKDNVTGLIWEMKVGGNDVRGDEGLHDADDRFNWYNTDPKTNGGVEGYSDNDGSICYGYNANIPASYCNTQSYVARVNNASLCGANNWRLPTLFELLNLVSLDRASPSIDTTYFPNTQSMFYWSSSPYFYQPGNAWSVSFDNGESNSNPGDGHHVRLVRLDQ